MRTLLNNKITLTLLTLACLFVAKSSFAETQLASDKNIRVTVPAESADALRVVYTKDGQKFEALPKDGEVVSINAVDLNTDTPGKINFTTSMDGEAYVIQMGETEPQDLDLFLGFSSTLDTIFIDYGSAIYLEAPGATVEVVKDPNINELNFDQPILIDANPKDFSKENGMLKIRFIVKAAEVDGDNNGDGDNNVNPPEGQEASGGGCSMTAGSTSGGPGLLLAALFALSLIVRTVKRK